MSWRIGYWRGSVRIRTTTLDDATQDEAASYMRILAANQLDLEYLRAEVWHSGRLMERFNR